MAGCLPSLLGDGEKSSETVSGEEKIYFVTGRRKYFSSPSLSQFLTVGRGHLSLVSLAVTNSAGYSSFCLLKDFWVIAGRYI
jgi:hypothetical protein